MSSLRTCAYALLIAVCPVQSLLASDSIVIGLGRQHVGWENSKNFDVGYYKNLGYLSLGVVGGYIPQGNLLSTPGGYVETNIGVDVSAGFFYGRITQGVALYLGSHEGIASHLQLPTAVAGGITNGNMRYGVQWKHFSDGSSRFNNHGLEFLGIEISYAVR